MTCYKHKFTIFISVFIITDCFFFIFLVPVIIVAVIIVVIIIEKTIVGSFSNTQTLCLG